MCSVCERFEAAGTLDSSGAVAQLVERLYGIQEVVDSSSISSTQFLPALLRTWDLVGFTLGGLVAGEGTFVVTTAGEPFADGTPKLRFVFEVKMATRDRPLLEALHAFLGCGSVYDRPRRKPHWEPITTFNVVSRESHHAVTIPFGERYLLPCEKRRQFELWRDAMICYEAETEAHRPKRGRSPCSIPGCEKPVRGRMLCRSHYYRATGY